MRRAQTMGTDRDRIGTSQPLRSVEFHILLSLAAGERHGYGILQDIETRDAWRQECGRDGGAAARTRTETSRS